VGLVIRENVVPRMGKLVLLKIPAVIRILLLVLEGSVRGVPRMGKLVLLKIPAVIRILLLVLEGSVRGAFHQDGDAAVVQSAVAVFAKGVHVALGKMNGAKRMSIVVKVIRYAHFVVYKILTVHGLHLVADVRVMVKVATAIATVAAIQPMYVQNVVGRGPLVVHALGKMHAAKRIRIVVKVIRYVHIVWIVPVYGIHFVPDARVLVKVAYSMETVAIRPMYVHIVVGLVGLVFHAGKVVKLAFGKVIAVIRIISVLSVLEIGAITLKLAAHASRKVESVTVNNVVKVFTVLVVFWNQGLANNQADEGIWIWKDHNACFNNIN